MTAASAMSGDLSPVLRELLDVAAKPSLGEGERAEAAISRLKGISPEELFAPHRIADREAARAVRAGLYLKFNALHESHEISQGLDTIEGSLWHAIMHRREGDFWNSKYWLRQAGRHPLFKEIVRAIETDPISKHAEIVALIERGSWHPAAFVDLCERAAAGEGALARAAERVQEIESEQLLRYCIALAISGRG